MRISATNLEAFRRWRDDESASVDDLLAYLRKQTKPSEAMLAGSALHKVLENAAPGDTLDEVRQGGFTFRFRVDGEFAMPDFRELKLERPVVIDGESHTLVAVVDVIGGTEVGDHKMTARADAEAYTDSVQWRFYLYLFGAQTFTYNLFQQYQPEPEPGVYIITDIVQVQFCRYPGMDDEVLALAGAFVEFCREHAPDLYGNERIAA